MSCSETKLKSKSMFDFLSRFLKSKHSIITKTAAADVLKKVNQFDYLGSSCQRSLNSLLMCDLYSLQGELSLSLKKKIKRKKIICNKSMVSLQRTVLFLNMRQYLRVEKCLVLSLILLFEKDSQTGNCRDISFS